MRVLIWLMANSFYRLLWQLGWILATRRSIRCWLSYPRKCRIVRQPGEFTAAEMKHLASRSSALIVKGRRYSFLAFELTSSFRHSTSITEFEARKRSVTSVRIPYALRRERVHGGNRHRSPQTYKLRDRDRRHGRQVVGRERRRRYGRTQLRDRDIVGVAD